MIGKKKGKEERNGKKKGKEADNMFTLLDAQGKMRGIGKGR